MVKKMKTKMSGCGMPANILQHFLELSYANPNRKDAPEGYTLDEALSDARVKVYPKNNSNEVVVVHRGSEGLTDWLDNASYLAYGKVKGTTSYKLHRERHIKAVKKYGAENIIGLGHSRGGLYVQELDKEFPMKEIITYNKAAGPTDILKLNPSKQTDVRVGNDVISMLAPTQLNNKIVHIPGTKNPFNLSGAHKPSELRQLGDQYIGLGLEGGGAKPKERTLPELKKLLDKYEKQLERAKNGFIYKTYSKNQFRSEIFKNPHQRQQEVIAWYIALTKNRIDEYEKNGKDTPIAINFTKDDYGKYYPSKADIKKYNEYKNLTNQATITRILKSLKKKEAKIKAGKEYKFEYENERVAYFLGAFGQKGSGLTDDIGRYLEKKLFYPKPLQEDFKDNTWQMIEKPKPKPNQKFEKVNMGTSTALLEPEDYDWVSVPNYHTPKKTGKGLILKF